jgi:hypothetical protein
MQIAIRIAKNLFIGKFLSFLGTISTFFVCHALILSYGALQMCYKSGEKQKKHAVAQKSATTRFLKIFAELSFKKATVISLTFLPLR